jgi:Uma2 family endonuclease
MTVWEKITTIEAFKAFVDLHTDRIFELIDGEIIEKLPGRTLNSELAHLIAFAVRLFCQTHNLPCYTSGEAGAYSIQGNVVVPDFAYKQTPMSSDYPDPVPPLWVVEVISPNDKARDIRAKRRIYRAAGILLWEMYPEDQSIDVYAPGAVEPTEVGIDGMLDAGNILPGFTLSMRELFKA